MRTPLFAMLALLMLAPVALAQESNDTKDTNETRPDDAAWVEDCPPDMMCAANEPIPYGDEGCIECSGPSDGGQAEPGQAIGPDDCIDCMRPPQDDGSNCMDGEQEGETCRDDVQYFGGNPDEPTRGPADGSCEYCRGDSDVVTAPDGAEGGITSVQDDEAQKNDVPAAGLYVVLAGFAVAIALVARKL